MDIIFEQSTLIQSFPPEEREEASQICIDKFYDTYIAYANTSEPDVELMNSIIDMYLFLGVTPPDAFIDIVERYLLEGISFDKLDIYMYLPQYEQIVKLLRPEYYVEVDRSKFHIFTINEVVYNIASKRYRIEDNYENAISAQSYCTRGVPLSAYYVNCYDPWSCPTRTLSYLNIYHIYYSSRLKSPAF